jgi:delta8-fatty-acid desaturase
MGRGGEFELDKPLPELDEETVWREDHGISLRVPKFYTSSERRMSKIKERADIPKEITMADVAKHHARDDLWIIVDGKAYDVTPFVETHPGGWLPMVNMGGKDCTDAFANYHPARVYKTLLPHYYIGDVVDYKESEFVKGHRAIRQRLLEEGRFETNPWFYRKLTLWLTFLFGCALYFTLGCTSFAHHMIGAVFLACFWQQMAFVGHDMGHNAVSHDWTTDNNIGLFVGNLTTGIGIAWWKRSHNVHHVCCNSIEHDPDIQHMPIFAVTPEIFKRFWSTYHAKWVEMDAAARLLLPYQHWLFYPVMGFARFNLYAQSWLLLLSGERLHHKKLEMLCLVLFACWLSLLVYSMPTQSNYERLAYILVSHILAGVLHVQICLSHFAMETYHGFAYNDDKDEWFRMQLATSLNIDCYPWMDWFHGGLQFQVEHHLWPRLPRHELRYAQKLVQEFCHEHNVEYHNLPWVEAQRQLIASMRETAKKASILYGDNSPEGIERRKKFEASGPTIFEALDASMRG